MRFPRPECPRRLAVVSVSAALLMPALTVYGQDGTTVLVPDGRGPEPVEPAVAETPRDHGPVAEETLLDLWTCWTTWLVVHVKNADQPVVAEAEDQDAEGADR